MTSCESTSPYFNPELSGNQPGVDAMRRAKSPSVLAGDPGKAPSVAKYTLASEPATVKATDVLAGRGL
eukprot:CAMPEP_0169307778 /NCGR_PEP_ID=MMETSP1017-20121227/1491_1 /TAXON_ID=342587 /ORGANISM="Karlodinium micrum, Strain CCMP2283" /LENGTH=67 /DNA_ID=CAMNT_0009401123 /DNA_START=172 /DNA_END=375 /DNA_ORIENTATION=+